jgi:pimeloyl-ACP methyl ester carboxylesterase
VPVAATREYARMWPGAQLEVLPQTGHLGLVTRPDDFAVLVAAFAERSERESARWRRIG